MLRDTGFREDLRRTLGTTPLPSEDRWVPAQAPRDHTAILLAGSALLIGATLAGALAGAISWSGGAAAPPAPRATPLARPTLIGDRQAAPLPNVHRNSEFGYSVLAPAWFRRVIVPVDAAESRLGLLSREVLTARNESGAITRPDSWEVAIEVWQRPGTEAGEIAASLGCARPCVMTETSLEWAGLAQTAVLSDPPGRIYLIDRGGTYLVVRYTIGDEDQRPADVTEDLLDGIARRIGLT